MPSSKSSSNLRLKIVELSSDTDEAAEIVLRNFESFEKVILLSKAAIALRTESEFPCCTTFSASTLENLLK